MKSLIFSLRLDCIVLTRQSLVTEATILHGIGVVVEQTVLFVLPCFIKVSR